MRRHSRNWVVSQVASNHIGQTNIFLKERMDEEWTMFCEAIDEVCRITTDPEVPPEKLAEWIKMRCMTRKTYDDWGGVTALHRDFGEWGKEQFTRPSFETAITGAGYAIHRGMVSKLILREDFNVCDIRRVSR